jgi:predicted metal-dependent phosphoesterase TrpH
VLKADLHIHTEYSYDCHSRLEDIVKRCGEIGINCLTVCDHDSVEGALRLKEMAPFEVIVGEEILTDHGEIMGLFLNERVPSHCTITQAIEGIRAQGGLIGVPHPFDNMARCGLGPDVMLEILKELNFIEVFNARSPRAEYAERSLEFARRYGLLGSAGSDAHTIGEIGNAYVEMPDFRTKTEFLKSLKQGEIKGQRASYLVHFASTWSKVKNRWRKSV